MMRVLVTGGGGFMGSWICRMLLEQGDQPVAFQRSTAPELEQAGVTVIQGDITDAQSVATAAAGCDAVIHVAGKAGVWGDYDLYHAINVKGTENILNACRAEGIRWLVYTSSPSVIHGGGDIEGADESLPYPEHFTSPYPETKAMAEQMVMQASNEQLATVSLRPHLIWGPGDNQLLPRLLERSAAGPLKLPAPEKLIDTVYVENAARVHLQALAALQNNPACHGKTYFISNDEPVPQGEIMSGLISAAGGTPDIRKISPSIVKAAGAACEWAWKLTGRDGEPPVTRWTAEHLSTAHWYDITAAKRDLGYEASISIAEGLKKLADASHEL